MSDVRVDVGVLPTYDDFLRAFTSFRWEHREPQAGSWRGGPLTVYVIGSWGSRGAKAYVTVQGGTRNGNYFCEEPYKVDGSLGQHELVWEGMKDGTLFEFRASVGPQR